MVAAGATAVIAVGFGVAVTGAVAGAQAPPSLRTVPGGVLAGAGIRLAAASQPPYCDIQRGAVQRRLLTAGAGGCAITRSQAESSLLPVFQGHVSEAVLARVTGPQNSDVGSDRLVWLVVVKSNLLVLPTTACAPPVASGPACAAGRMGPVSTEAVVFVDATTGEVLTTVAVPGTAGPGAPAGSGA